MSEGGGSGDLSVDPEELDKYGFAFASWGVEQCAIEANQWIALLKKNEFSCIDHLIFFSLCRVCLIFVLIFPFHFLHLSLGGYKRGWVERVTHHSKLG